MFQYVYLCFNVDVPVIPNKQINFIEIIDYKSVSQTFSQSVSQTQSISHQSTTISGHIQVAQAPDRHDPGTSGEIDYRYVGE